MSAYAIRASAAVSVIVLAGLLSFSGGDKPAVETKIDPSVPPASEVFAKSQPAEGNVHDMTY